MRLPLLVLIACLGAQAQTIHYILTLGNSNSSGYFATPVLTSTQPYSNLMLSGSSFIPLTETPNAVEGPMSSDGNQMSLLSSGYVAAVQNNFFLGGAYTDLKQGTTTYNAAITAVQTAVTAAAGLTRSLQAVSAIYMAGGTDFVNQVPAATYEADMVALQANLQTDAHVKTGQTGVLPLFLDINSKWTETGTPSETPVVTIGGGKGIQFGVVQAWRDHQGGIFIVGPHYQQTFQPTGTGADHTDNVSNRNYGEQSGKVMKQVLVDGVPWVPTVPRAISLSGATITFRCWVPVPPLVVDTASVPDWTGSVGTHGAFRYKGFEFFDDSGSPPHITAISIASDTLTLTLASTPTGTAGSFRLRYDYTGAINTIQGTSTAPGGNVRDSDTATGVGGADHLYNWLLGPIDEAIPFAWSPTPTIAATGGIVQ